MNLRPYQTECVESTLEGFNEYQRQLVVAPTGAGKTIIFAELARRIQPKRTLILAHREELITQAVDKIARSTGIFAQVEKAEQAASLHAPVVVASVQSMIRRLDKWPKAHFELVVADEAHHAISASWQTVLSHFDALVLGVTATPDRSDKRNLGQYFENIAYEITLLDLIKQGYLSPIKVQAIPLEINLGCVRRTAGDYNDADLGNVLAPYLREIAVALKSHAAGRKALVFVPLIATSKTFVEICVEEGIRAAHVDGNSPDRSEILQAFSKGEFDLLSNAMLLTEGYDEPTVDCVVVLRPTQSRALYSQMVGRGTRLSPGKNDLLLLDFLWMHERHNLIRPAHLIATCEQTASDMTRNVELAAKADMAAGFGELQLFELEELESAAREQREAKLREQLAAQAKRQARMVDAMEYCLSLHNVEVADWEPTMAWHSKPLTDKQKELLTNMGIDPETVKGRGHASAIIDLFISRSRLNLARPKQVHWLRKLGHPSPDTATFEEASEFLDHRFNRSAA